VKASRRHELRKRALLRTQTSLTGDTPPPSEVVADAPPPSEVSKAEAQEALSEPAPPVVHAMAPPPTEAAEEVAIMAPAADLPPRHVPVVDVAARASMPPEMEESERLFFSTERPVVASEAPEATEIPARISRIASPEAARRRKKASTYVAAVFAGCAILVAFAAARGLLRGAEGSANAQPAASHIEPKGGSQAPTPPAASVAALPATPTAITTATATATAAPEPTTAPVAALAPTSEPSAAPTTPDPIAAKAKKKAAQQALERGKVALAIEESEAAVALDPEDGESWLILGAAYQEKGEPKKAREAFTSCLKLGKRGPKGECGAMLR
jgi:hypothetical protein